MVFYTYRYFDENKKMILYKLEECNNLEKIIIGICDLIKNNFLDRFGNNIDKIFVSKYNIDENPIKNKKEFFIDIKDINKATKYLKDLN